MKKEIKKEESKVGIGITVKEGIVNTTTAWDNANISDLTIAVSYLELIKIRLLGLIDRSSKKDFKGIKKSGR